jgi:hypothetical protein
MAAGQSGPTMANVRLSVHGGSGSGSGSSSGSVVGGVVGMLVDVVELELELLELLELDDDELLDDPAVAFVAGHRTAGSWAATTQLPAARALIVSVVVPAAPATGVDPQTVGVVTDTVGGRAGSSDRAATVNSAPTE